MNRFGYNFLAQTVADRGRAEDRLSLCPPQSSVIMDDAAWAIHLKQRFPSTLIIHRAYKPFDPSLHEKMTPTEFVAENRHFANTGVLVQVYNEPDTYKPEFRSAVEFCAQVYDIGTPLGMRFAFLNVGMGHCAEFAVPALDPLLRRIAGYVKGSVFGVHEYARASMKDERPDHIGRFELIANRCRQLGLAPVQFAVTEYGRDKGGGVDDGYKGTIGSAGYAPFLIGGVDQYVPFNAPVCVFGYGRGGQDLWRNFNANCRRCSPLSRRMRLGRRMWRGAPRGRAGISRPTPRLVREITCAACMSRARIRDMARS